MEYFFTFETALPTGVGFMHWSLGHIVWLILIIASAAAGSAAYSRASEFHRRLTDKIIGAVMLLIFRPWHIQGVQFSGKLWVLLACVIILGTVLSFGLFQSGCSIVGSLVGSVLSSIEPVGSVVISVLFLHTSFSWLDLLGFFLILVTIPLMAIGKAKEQ